MSPCSSSCAFGMISLSTKLLTVDRISCWMSVRSAVCARRGIDLLRGSGVRSRQAVWARPRGVPRVPRHRAPRPGSSVPRVSTGDDHFYQGDPSPPPGYGPPGYGPPGYGPPGYGPPGYPPPGYGAPGYPPQWRRPTNTLAILALVLSFVFAPAGLVLGLMARKQIRRTGEEGEGLALAGIIVGSIFTALFLLMLLGWIIAFASLAGSSSFGP